MAAVLNSSNKSNSLGSNERVALNDSSSKAVKSSLKSKSPSVSALLVTKPKSHSSSRIPPTAAADNAISPSMSMTVEDRIDHRYFYYHHQLSTPNSSHSPTTPPSPLSSPMTPITANHSVEIAQKKARQNSSFKLYFEYNKHKFGMNHSLIT